MLHKAAEGFGSLPIASRSVFPVSHALPDGEYNILIGDWFNSDYTVLKRRLDMGMFLGMLDDVHINGLSGQSHTFFKVDPGVYSPNAYRGFARDFIKDLEQIRPRAILDIIRSGENFSISSSTKLPEQGVCERCGYISSQ
ncbi:hypothetical protein KI387_031873, partial [Taxus chinensis]